MLAYLEKHLWILKIAIGIVFLIVFQVILSLVFKFIKLKSNKKKYDQRKRFYEIFYNPIKILIWIFVLSYIFSTIAKKFELASFLINIERARNIAIILDLTWLLLNWKKEVQLQIVLKSQKRIDKTSIEFFGKILSIFIIFISFLIILQKLGISILPLVAFGGVGVAAFALASKDVLANFFGGLMIYMTRPFVKNDLVEIPSLNIIGYIEHIGWYNTCVRELGKAAVYIPNNVFSNIVIKNDTRRTHRRLEETIKIRYLDFSKITIIIEEIKKILLSNNKIDASHTPYVYFSSYGDFSLDIMIKVYTLIKEFSEFLQLKQEILIQIHLILEKHGSQMPFPITSVDFLSEIKK